ncbi:MAG: Holliday junction DNA helicase RuvB [Planctomycetota bacterium]|jgi:Holliday junction DNA helicase RuvB
MIATTGQIPTGSQVGIEPLAPGGYSLAVNSHEPTLRPDAFQDSDKGNAPDGESGDAWTAPSAGPRERELENVLRPRTMAEFVGQGRVVSNLQIALQAARGRGEPLDHVLLSGPPGLGKTSLARILAAEMDTDLHTTTGPALDRPKDLVGILTQLTPGSVLFIDEIHRVSAAVEEYLYSAMEDFTIDFTIDQGPNARVLPLSLARFTLVGATTREGLLSAPFRGRFGLLERMDPYPTDELEQILRRAASILDVQLTDTAATRIAARCRGTPRVANRFLRRVRDLAQVRGESKVDEALAREALERLGVDENGLEEMDRRVLLCLSQNESEATGLKTIAAAVGETEDTIEEVYEPHLLRSGFLRKTGRGRIITPAGRTAVGLPPLQNDTNAQG